MSATRILVLGLLAVRGPMHGHQLRRVAEMINIESWGDVKVGALYGAYDEKNKMDNRSLYVIGPDGKIAYKTQPFRVLAADAYTELGDVIDKLSPPPTPSDK